MSGGAQQDGRKAKGKLEEQVFVELQRSAEALMRRLAEVLKPAELTATQYNVLRILRGARPDGIPCREVSTRMVNHDPDITRLLDRLEARGLVSRLRCDKDRRVVYARITDGGLELLGELDDVIGDFMVAQLGHLGRERLRALADLLERARGTEP